MHQGRNANILGRSTGRSTPCRWANCIVQVRTTSPPLLFLIHRALGRVTALTAREGVHPRTFTSLLLYEFGASALLSTHDQRELFEQRAGSPLHWQSASAERVCRSLIIFRRQSVNRGPVILLHNQTKGSRPAAA